MHFSFKYVLTLLLVFIVLNNALAEHEKLTVESVRTAPHKDIGRTVIDGTGAENSFISDSTRSGLPGKSRVSVSTVALFTLAMAAATGLGAVPFFFVELNPHWAGKCNGMAAGVMLAASFDLVQEGQDHGSGNWVVLGILSGGIFIWLCKKVMVHSSHPCLCPSLDCSISLELLATLVFSSLMNNFKTMVYIIQMLLKKCQKGMSCGLCHLLLISCLEENAPIKAFHDERFSYKSRPIAVQELLPNK